MSNNLKDAQQIMLNILVEFDRICTKHDLVYWLDYGTLLGAVRHKGFIPWDDDLDVSMPRDDYVRFLEIAKYELNEKYFLQNKDTDKKIYIYFSKIRHRGSTFIEKHEINRNVGYHQGIYIDIFPVNYIRSSILTRFSYSLLKKTIKLFSNRYLSINFIAKPLIDLANSYHNNTNDLMVRGAEMMTEELNIDKQEVFPLVKHKFKEKKFNIPHNTDKYLKLFYGNTYMNLPPVHLRKTHHHNIIIDEI